MQQISMRDALLKKVETCLEQGEIALQQLTLKKKMCEKEYEKAVKKHADELEKEK